MMDYTGHPLEGTSFAASTGTHYAAEAASETYRAGGNAADAAVAAAAAVSVTEPLMSSVGGGGVALVRDPSGRGALPRPSSSSMAPGCAPSSGEHRRRYQAPSEDGRSSWSATVGWA